MGRSSSSYRKKKRSKVRNPKRSRKYGSSKKLRSRVSDEESSEISMSSSSYSSSSEDCKYRSSKRSRIRVKKYVVSRKKKSKKRSYSSESSEESSRVKKRAMSKRKWGRESKERVYSEKKRKRDDSVSSSSESVSDRGVGTRKKVGKDERESKRVRYRSTSPLWSERSDSGEDLMNDEVLVENSSRRLRSVITVVKRDEEDQEIDRDEHKEELVYDLDDYPSCRSNESNDTGRQRDECDNGSSVDREKKIRLENVKGDDVSDGDNEERLDGSNRRSDELGKANVEIEQPSDVSRIDGETNSDDLESILRKRALENLRKFRGGIRTDEGNANSGKKSSFLNSESARIRSSAENGCNTVYANSTKEGDAKEVVSNKIRTASEKVSQINEIVLDRNTDQNESLPEVDADSNEKVKVGISPAKPKLVRPVLTGQLSKSNSSLSQGTSQPVPQTGNDLHRNGEETASSSIENPENNVTETSSISPDKPKQEANEGSQFEQKTMSVMRGGELVQVSYKVYIPKKPPALARRQLRR